MIQLETKSSMAISRVLQQTNFSALSTLPRNLINYINSEGDIYMTAPKRCAKLWIEFRRQDFTNVQIPYKVSQQIFDRCKEDFVQLLKLNNHQDFFDLFDQDNDGFLNEDEQILVFSVIKEKMSIVSNQLLKIQQYTAFKQLMIQIREIEKNISEYQNILRQKIYNQEVKTYQTIGFEKLDDFIDRYYGYFQQFEQSKAQRIESQIKLQNDEMNQLQEKLSKNTEFLKVKPKRKLKDLQTQEKLVSLDERVEEALDFRRELKNMEKSEEQRVAQEQENRIDRQREEMLRKHRKQMEQLKIKIIEQEHKLIIQLKKDYIVLQKEIGLHKNEIERIQSLATQGAIKKGQEEGELKRMKDRAKIQNFIISDSKRPISTAPPINYESKYQASPRSPQQQHVTKNEKAIQEIRNIINSKNLTQFYIKKKYGSDLPVNYKAEPYKRQGDNHERIEKILSVKKKSPHDILPSLTELYDDELKQINLAETQKSESDLQLERQKKKQFIMEKLQEQS
ncbi:hypothetical protein pb186bvf_002357 [Paramecium bursaria]